LIDRLNTELVYNFTLDTLDYLHIENLESIFKTSNVKFKCVKQSKRNDTIQLSYTIKASQENHKKLVIDLFNEKTVLSFDA
jgi:hypothetical protein